jgi:hypothetical protein
LSYSSVREHASEFAGHAVRPDIHNEPDVGPHAATGVGSSESNQFAARRPQRTAAIRRTPGNASSRRRRYSTLSGDITVSDENETDGTADSVIDGNGSKHQEVPIPVSPSLARNSTATSNATFATFTSNKAVENDSGGLSRHSTFLPSRTTPSRQNSAYAGQMVNLASDDLVNPSPIPPPLSLYTSSTHSTSRAVENDSLGYSDPTLYPSDLRTMNEPSTSSTINTSNTSTRAVENGFPSSSSLPSRDSSLRASVSGNDDLARTRTASSAATRTTISSTGAIENGSVREAQYEIPHRAPRPLPPRPLPSTPHALQLRTFLYSPPKVDSLSDKGGFPRATDHGGIGNISRNPTLSSNITATDSSRDAVENVGSTPAPIVSSLHPSSPTSTTEYFGWESTARYVRSPESIEESASMSSLGLQLPSMVQEEESTAPTSHSQGFSTPPQQIGQLPRVSFPMATISVYIFITPHSYCNEPMNQMHRNHPYMQLPAPRWTQRVRVDLRTIVQSLLLYDPIHLGCHPHVRLRMEMRINQTQHCGDLHIHRGLIL